MGHIILIPSQPVFALSPKWCVLSGETTNTNCIVFGLTRPGLEPTIYRTRLKYVLELALNNNHVFTLYKEHDKDIVKFLDLLQSFLMLSLMRLNTNNPGG
jgi:hypothetical protein